MDEEEFDSFRHFIVDPMIRRHEEMFPLMHRRVSYDPAHSGSSPRTHPGTAAPAERYLVTDRYAPCPCNSMASSPPRGPGFRKQRIQGTLYLIIDV